MQCLSDFYVYNFGKIFVKPQENFLDSRMQTLQWSPQTVCVWIKEEKNEKKKKIMCCN